MSNIEWTDKTWNPIVGCSKISEGCRNCYAINQAHRNWAMAQALPEERRGRLAYYEGLTEKRGNWVGWTGKVVFVPEALEEPLKRKKPTKYFVNSMSDLFHESVADEWIDQVFAVMALTPQHIYQILTKRPERMLEYFGSRPGRTISIINAMSQWIGEGCKYEKTVSTSHFRDKEDFLPFPNVWLGVTVENQKAANERIPLLLQAPAAVRFLSCEPLLEKIDFLEVSIQIIEDAIGSGKWNREKRGAWEDYNCLEDLDQVIVGGESGHKARLCNEDWIRSIVRQCKNAGTSVFVKQFGSSRLMNCRDINDPDFEKLGPFRRMTGKGSNIDEFPEDLKIREFPKCSYQG